MWDCCGVYADVLRLKEIADEPRASIGEPYRSEIARLTMQILASTVCIASELPTSTEEWELLNVCARHAPSFGVPSQSAPSQ